MFSAHKVTNFFLTSNDFCKFFFVPTCISLPQRLSPYLSGVPITSQSAALSAGVKDTIYVVVAHSVTLSANRSLDRP